MKKLLFAVSALAALSLLAPSTGLAQATNILSFYADEAATQNNMTGVASSTPVNIYLVVQNPTNPNLDDAAVSFVQGVEFGYSLSGGFALGIAFAVQNTDVGGAPGNHIVGFAQPFAVTDGTATLATLTVLYTSDATPAFISLNPATPASVPGYMAVIDFSDIGHPVPCLPPFENFDYNVFAINDVVAVEDSSLDQVKAMYR